MRIPKHKMAKYKRIDARDLLKIDRNAKFESIDLQSDGE